MPVCSVCAVINGEKAVFNIPVFAQKREKTLDMLIRRAVEMHFSEAPRPPLVSRKSTGEILSESEPSAVFARNKEEQRRIEFAKFGQVCVRRLRAAPFSFTPYSPSAAQWHTLVFTGDCILLEFFCSFMTDSESENHYEGRCAYQSHYVGHHETRGLLLLHASLVNPCYLHYTCVRTLYTYD